MTNIEKLARLINEFEDPQLMLSLLQLMLSRPKQEEKGGAHK